MAVILDLIQDKEFIGKVLELKIFTLNAYVKCDRLNQVGALCQRFIFLHQENVKRRILIQKWRGLISTHGVILSSRTLPTVSYPVFFSFQSETPLNGHDFRYDVFVTFSSQHLNILLQNTHIVDKMRHQGIWSSLAKEIS